jgi:uncharacterized DUF497 family protein
MKFSFEWNEEKASANLRRHKVSFDEAATVFSDLFSNTIADPDHSTDEERYIDIGTSDKGRVLYWSCPILNVVKIYELLAAARQRQLNGDVMKKEISKTKPINKDDEMRSEYDFTSAVRGKHYRAMQAGYTITIHRADGTILVKEVKPVKGAIVLEPDVQKYFPDSDSVNATLRSLIRLLPHKKKSIS